MKEKFIKLTTYVGSGYVLINPAYIAMMYVNVEDGETTTDLFDSNNNQLCTVKETPEEIFKLAENIDDLYIL